MVLTAPIAAASGDSSLRIYHDLLVGKCDVNAGKPEPAQAVQQRAQFLSVGPCYLNELIMAAQTKMTSRLFVHCW